MRASHLKFHLTAISLICLVIVLLYAAIGPKPHPQTASQSNNSHAITIEQATWGENCNPYIQQAINDWRLPPLGSTAKATPKPQLVTLNNALPIVKAACEGQITCQLQATPDVMQSDPLKSCYKRLKVGYRCFTFDRLWLVETNQGSNLTIDCREGAPAPTTVN